MKPGSKIEAEIIREGKTKKIKIEVGQLPENFSVASASQGNKSNAVSYTHLTLPTICSV